MSARVYSRAIVASVPSTETSLLFDEAQAGLIAGTVPTNGILKRSRNRGSTKRGRGVAGDDHEVRSLAQYQPAEDREHARG